MIRRNIVMAQTGHVVMRRFHMRVRNDRDVYLQTRFDQVNIGALFIQQEGGDIDRHLHVYRRAVIFHCLFLDDAQDVQGGRISTADMADTVAARAWRIAGFFQTGLQTLA